jgi:DNA-binding NarL/FixJ family response regulator
MSETEGKGRGLDLLVVDRTPAHVEVCKATVESSGLCRSFRILGSFDEAVAFLSDVSEAEAPSLVVSALRIPSFEEGFMFLEWLRHEDGDYWRVPRIVLSASATPAQIARAYWHGAQSFIPKPLGLDQLAERWKTILSFYTAVERAPVERQSRRAGAGGLQEVK